MKLDYTEPFIFNFPKSRFNRNTVIRGFASIAKQLHVCEMVLIDRVLYQLQNKNDNSNCLTQHFLSSIDIW